jgi:hypothetical protein
MRDGVRVSGRELVASVQEYALPGYQLGALVPIHPAYFIGGVMGNMARTYEKFRYKSLVFHFISRQPTSATGEIILSTTSTLLEPAEDALNANFLARAMSRGNATLGPLWQNHSIAFDVDDQWRLVDAFINSDVDDNVLGELQAYTQSAVKDVAGYILMDYVLEFSTTMYQPHSTAIPIPLGVGATYTCVDSSATPTSNNSVQLTNSALTGQGTGTIYRAILNFSSSTLGTSGTAANAFKVGTAKWTNVATIASNSTDNITLIDGMQFYLAVADTSLYVYASLEEAIEGNSSGAFFYQTTLGTASSFSFVAYQLRVRNAALIGIQ